MCKQTAAEQLSTYLEDRLRLEFEVFSHRGDNEDAAEESPGLLEILTPIKSNELTKY